MHAQALMLVPWQAWRDSAELYCWTLQHCWRWRCQKQQLLVDLQVHWLQEWIHLQQAHQLWQQVQAPEAPAAAGAQLASAAWPSQHLPAARWQGMRLQGGCHALQTSAAPQLPSTLEPQPVWKAASCPELSAQALAEVRLPAPALPCLAPAQSPLPGDCWVRLCLAYLSSLTKTVQEQPLHDWRCPGRPAELVLTL